MVDKNKFFYADINYGIDTNTRARVIITRRMADGTSGIKMFSCYKNGDLDRLGAVLNRRAYNMPIEEHLPTAELFDVREHLGEIYAEGIKVKDSVNYLVQLTYQEAKENRRPCKVYYIDWNSNQALYARDDGSWGDIEEAGRGQINFMEKYLATARYERALKAEAETENGLDRWKQQHNYVKLC